MFRDLVVRVKFWSSLTTGRPLISNPVNDHLTVPIDRSDIQLHHLTDRRPINRDLIDQPG